MRAGLLLLLIALAQGGGGSPVTVSAAISLTEALQEVAAAYRAAGGGPIRFNFGGSNVLSRQIVSGAPVDVFISADEAQMDVVERAGLVAPGTRMPLLANRLVIVVGSDREPSLTSAGDLAGAGFRRIAIGDPEAVPAGVYARRYLERAGLWTRLEPKMVPSRNVRAALTAVQNGSADAAIVYATDARAAPQLRAAVTITGRDAPVIVYPACALRRGGGRPSGAAFLRFLRSDRAGRIFERHGFIPLAPPA